MVRSVLQGNGLHHFETSANNQIGETDNDFEQCPQEVLEFVFPEQASQQQKCWMHKQLFKPHKVRTWVFVAQVIELNDYFSLFPLEEQDDSMFTEVAKLPEDMILKILEFGSPRHFQDKMIRQGFDPIHSTMSKLTQFYKCLEHTEEQSETHKKEK